MIESPTSAFELTPSVRAYLSDPAVRTGVDALLAIKPNALPAGLEWHELRSYFAARTAAEVTKFEYGEMLHDLWSRIWGDVLAASWSPVPFSDLLADDQGVTPETCWNEEAFYTYHRAGDRWLYTAVSITGSKTLVAFSIEDDDGPMIQEDFGPFEWLDDTI